MLSAIVTFGGALLLIATVAGLPIAAMWANGQFVGQRPAPAWGRWIVKYGLSAGIGGGAVMATLSLSPFDYWDGLVAATLSGSAIAGIIALQDR